MKQAGSKLDYLLDDVCIRLGFCLPADARHRIASLEHLNASTFATAVLRAEGFDHPEYETEWMSRLMERFEVYFGRSAIYVADGLQQARGIDDV